MRKNPFMKAVLRKPFHSLLMLVLIGAITYGIASHAVEYIIVLQTTNQLEKYYRPIGMLDAEDYDVTRGRELVSKSPYVEFEDLIRYPQGVLQGYNADVSSLYDRAKSEELGIEAYVSDVIFYGALQAKKYVIVGEGQYHLSFKVNKVEAAYPDYMLEDNIINVAYQPKTEGELQEEFDSLIVGEQYLVRAYYSEATSQPLNRWRQIIDDKVGEWFFLDKLTEDNLYFYPVREGDTVDYSDKKLAGLKEHLELVNANQRAMQIYGTKDMSLMPYVQESSRVYYLVDGRWLNREDDLNKKNVCVVHSFFADWRGLSLGDKINIELRDMVGGYAGYITPMYTEQWSNWRSYETVEREFEIVGIYDTVFFDITTARGNTMFIPDSSIPENFLPQMKEKVYPSSYSFVLRSAQDQQIFLVENQGELESMGITVSFMENNADNFGIAAKSLKKSTQMSVVIFSVTFLPVMVIVAFFYLSQRRREFAIARAMGISRSRTIHQVGAASIWIGLPGIVIGGIAAWYKTLEEAKNLFKDFATSKTIEYSSSLMIFWLLLLVFLFALFMVLIILGCSYMANQSVFDLLQGHMLRRNKKYKSNKNSVLQLDSHKKHAEESDKLSGEASLSLDSYKEIMVELTEKRVSKIHKFITSIEYLYRHMIRSYGKLLLMLIISLGFIATYSWFDTAIEKKMIEVEQLYHSVVIDGEILKTGIFDISQGGGFINPRVVSALQDSGLIKESYLEKTTRIGVILNFHPEKTSDADTKRAKATVGGAVSFSDWESFFMGTGAGVTVEFMNGYNKEVFMENKNEIVEAILPYEQLEELGKRWDEIVYLIVGEEYTPCRIVGTYKGLLSDAVAGGAIIMSEYHMQQFTKGNFVYATARFTFDPAKNKELLQRGKEFKEMVSSAKFGDIVPRLVIRDAELHQAIEPMERNLSLLKIIYPIAVAAFTLIGGVLNFLMILFRAKEAAIMMVLGGSKGRVRILFVLEQALTYLVGMLLGITLILILQEEISPNIQINLLLYLIGCTSGSILGSIFVTNKIPLELLQVKE